MIWEQGSGRSAGRLCTQKSLSWARRKGFGPDAGRDVNFEWPLWLKHGSPSFLLPKTPGCLCMTSSPNYAPPYPCESELSQSPTPQNTPTGSTTPPSTLLNCTAPTNPYASPAVSVAVALPRLPPISSLHLLF